MAARDLGEVRMTMQGESFPAGSRDPQLLLAAMQRISQEQLGAALDRVLRRADDYLFDSSNSGGGTELTALRDLRRARAQIAAALRPGPGGRIPPAPGCADAGRGGRTRPRSAWFRTRPWKSSSPPSSWSTTSPASIAPSLELLEKRLAALTERPMLAASENPVGPKFLAEAMSNALARTGRVHQRPHRPLQVL